MTTEPLRVGQRVRTVGVVECVPTKVSENGRTWVIVSIDGQRILMPLELLEPLPTDAAGEGKEEG